jgi:uncharacterized protein (DUF1697 family)
MTAYAAFLRGVSPMNAKMPELARAFAAAGFEDVATVASSGNVVFRARGQAAALEKKAEAAMGKTLGKTFVTFVRPIAELEALLAADPFAKHRVPAAAKRIVTFFRERPAHIPKLPVTVDKATIYAVQDREILTAYVPQPGNPAFMALIEKTFGKNLTTRTWDAVARIVARAPRG